MTVSEAAEILDVMIASFSNQPNQFSFSVSVIGMSSNVQGGGIGALGIAQGGGIGISASADASNVHIAQEAGNAEIAKQIQLLTETLTQVSQELRAENPDKGKALGMVAAVKGKIPDVILSVAQKLIESAVTGGLG